MANPKSKSEASRAQVGRIGALAKGATDVVLQAAAVLEEELAAGIVAARKVQERAKKERKFDAKDLDEIAERFQANGRELLQAIGDRFSEVRRDDTRSDSVGQLAERFVRDAQGAFDTLVELAKVAPELIRKKEPAKAQKTRSPKSRTTSPRASSRSRG